MGNISVAFLAPEFLPNWGGGGTYSIELIKELSKYEDVDVHVLTVERDIEGLKRYSQEDMERYYDDKISIHITSQARDTFLYNGLFQYKISRLLPKYLKKYGFDLIHAQHAYMSDLLIKHKRLSAPSLTTVHTTILSQRLGTKSANIQFSSLEKSEKYTVGGLPFLFLLERYYFKRTKYTIFVSNYMRDLVTSNYPVEFDLQDVIHTGVRPELFSQVKREDAECLFPEFCLGKKIILFTGRLIALKGVQVIIDAMKEVVDYDKGVHFVFAGSGNLEPWLKMILNKKINEKYYTFLGQVAYDKMPFLYSLANIYILPSFSESSPISVLEAMASRTPVIATNVGGIPEIVTDGHDGYLIEKGNSSQLAEKIKILLSDEKVAKKFSEMAIETIQKRFTWTKIAEKTINTYKKIVE